MIGLTRGEYIINHKMQEKYNQLYGKHIEAPIINEKDSNIRDMFEINQMKRNIKRKKIISVVLVGCLCLFAASLYLIIKL